MSEAVPEYAMTLRDESATERLAGSIARRARPGDVIALHGDLGVGKTCFARAFIAALADEREEVPSPTFTLVQTYETRIGTVWHFDLYRLKSAHEIQELGFEEAHAGGISLIEWPDRLGDTLPAVRLDVSLDFAGPPDGVRRSVRVSGHGDWPRRLAGAFDDV